MTLIEHNPRTTKVTSKHLRGEFHTIVILTMDDLENLERVRGMSIDILFVPRKLEEWEWEEVKHSVAGQMYIL
jgi:hypothetical protein